MKKLLYILLFVPVVSYGQDNDPCYSINNVYQEIEDANQPITLDLLSGWNMIGYSCVNESDVLDILSPISDKIVIAKNNAGSVYMPEFGFNGIGDLLPNQGYLVKMSETVIGFELCTNPIPFHQLEGCTDCAAMNFYLLANVDDGSCQYNTCSDPQADNYQEVLPCIYYGCNDPLAANYDPYANTDDGSCVVAEACPYENYLEYSPDAISYNENLCVNLLVEGCMDNTALNYDSQANLDDGACQYIYGCTLQDADNYNAEATTDDGSCIYFGCIEPTAGNYDETANTDDGSCLEGGCMNPTAENFNPDAGVDNGSCIIYGCTLSSFPNYNSVATIGDGSCDMNSLDVFGCTDSLAFNLNIYANIDNETCGDYPIVGMLVEGGMVFYIDETNEHGLVAALEDIGNFEWGCFGSWISGADGLTIGTGYQNTLDIVAGCSETPIAASEALAYESGGYNDWYLPSEDELLEMYYTIGNGGSQGNIGGFENMSYWASTEGTSQIAWVVHFFNGGTSNWTYYKIAENRVRVIRAF